MTEKFEVEKLLRTKNLKITNLKGNKKKKFLSKWLNNLMGNGKGLILTMTKPPYTSSPFLNLGPIVWSAKISLLKFKSFGMSPYLGDQTVNSGIALGGFQLEHLKGRSKKYMNI